MLCGIDEAGRGALAGELVVAGCAFKSGYDDEISALVADSKTLSEKKREQIFNEILPKCNYLAVFFRNTIIDERGLSWCLKQALIIMQMHFKGYDLLFDGNCNYGQNAVKTMIKADSKVAQVSAASIIAKVSRDRQMRLFSVLYPHFNYQKHKGYGTKAHLQALAKYGKNELTRLSFGFSLFDFAN